ncbi:AraC family transcriptional regulator [Paenibacillus oceani]|uniref:AraC family transcriptional regulator n=1 Tax=Paenibacillus oceani TaxID=2772510 RepID=A0A927CCH6_9BACL|nr:AraC family transcriptional regulator [Paenibacillus oceani]MBD2865110.1 AraC family transcriptional regulator [Paenibacillus oceani]
MNWNEHALLWSHASIRIIDIRYFTLQGEEAPPDYLLPASGFLYVASGYASVHWGPALYKVNRNQLLHGGKGTRLALTPEGDLFAYYLVLYKASLNPPHSRSLQHLYAETKPFETSYNCSLSQASLLQVHLADMFRHWQQSQPMDRLRVNATFHQFIYELVRMLEERTRSGDEPDLVQQTIRYLQEHYREPVTMEELAAMFSCSITHLSRLFKRETGVSPIHYLIQIRMKHAEQWLLGGQTGLRDIAAKIGYPDAFYFSRMFKKHTGYSPLQFRRQFAETRQMPIVPDSPLNRAGSDMDEPVRPLYNDNDNHYHLEKGENTFMQFAKSPLMATTLLLGVTLLLGACQSAANSSPSGGTPETPSSATRVYKHIDGESEIPVHPKRVFTDLKVGQLMALGVKPVGSASYPLQTGFFDITGIEDLGKFPLNLEKLASLEPDLIILTEAWRDGGGYEAFSKIAPTVVIPNHGEDLGEELRMFGDIVGKKEQAERWLAEFETKVSQAKQQVNAVIGQGQTFSILNVRAKQFFVYDDVNMGGNVIYKFLGLKPQAKVLSDVIQGDVWEISAEVIPEYIGDHLLIATNKGAEEALEKNRYIWANTAAVRNGKVYDINFDLFLLTDPISVSHQLDMVTKMLVEKNR